MASAITLEPSYGMDKLSYEIFSILESKFLFDSKPSVPPTPARAAGKVRILTVDAGGSTAGLLAAVSLLRLESSLRRLSGDDTARISDFFDLAGGSGAGGVLVSLLFARGPSGRPLLSAADALRFIVASVARHRPKKRGLFSFSSGNSLARSLKEVFGDRTLKDTVKPILVPCFDLATGAPFVFSRADAMETDGYDFMMREVCRATMGEGKGMRSVDGRTAIEAAAIDGGVATGNPAAAAITHVLNNKMEFPGARSVEDLFLVSIGNGEAGGTWRSGSGSATPSPAGIARIARDGVSDMIDQAVAMALGQSRATSYVRIQGRDLRPPMAKSSTDPTQLLLSAEQMLTQKNVESVLFHGKKLSDKTNDEKLEWAAGELVKERDRRSKSPFPMVIFKQGSPRISSSSGLSSSTSSSP